MKVVIAIPAYNEASILEKNIIALSQFCQSHFAQGQVWEIVIADNNSTDATGEIGQRLAAQHSQVKYFNTGSQGKGLAIKSAWEKFSGDIYCFMDADLATDLQALPSLIEGISQAGFDMVVGSRFHSDSKVVRSPSRKFFSFGYQMLLRILLGLKVKDAPCGFKAINQKIKDMVLPKIQNSKWFFDSELVITAEKLGYKIKEVPVVWHDPREGGDLSRVSPVKLAVAYFKEVLALKQRLKTYR